MAETTPIQPVCTERSLAVLQSALGFAPNLSPQSCHEFSPLNLVYLQYFQTLHTIQGEGDKLIDYLHHAPLPIQGDKLIQYVKKPFGDLIADMIHCHGFFHWIQDELAIKKVEGFSYTEFHILRELKSLGNKRVGDSIGMLKDTEIRAFRNFERLNENIDFGRIDLIEQIRDINNGKYASSCAWVGYKDFHSLYVMFRELGYSSNEAIKKLHDSYLAPHMHPKHAEV